MSNDLVLKIIFAASSLKENVWLETPGLYEPPLPALRMFWLTSAEKNNFGRRLAFSWAHSALRFRYLDLVAHGAADEVQRRRLLGGEEG